MRHRLPHDIEAAHVKTAKLSQRGRERAPDREQALDLILAVALRIELTLNRIDYFITEVTPGAILAKQGYAAILKFSDVAVPVQMIEATPDVRLVSSLSSAWRRLIVIVQDALRNSTFLKALGEPRQFLRLLDAEAAQEKPPVTLGEEVMLAFHFSTAEPAAHA